MQIKHTHTHIYIYIYIYFSNMYTYTHMWIHTCNKAPRNQHQRWLWLVEGARLHCVRKVFVLIALWHMRVSSCPRRRYVKAWQPPFCNGVRPANLRGRFFNIEAVRSLQGIKASGPVMQECPVVPVCRSQAANSGSSRDSSPARFAMSLYQKCVRSCCFWDGMFWLRSVISCIFVQK